MIVKYRDERTDADFYELVGAPIVWEGAWSEQRLAAMLGTAINTIKKSSWIRRLPPAMPRARRQSLSKRLR